MIHNLSTEMHSVADRPSGVFPRLGETEMSSNSRVIPMDEDDQQLINNEQAWMEYQKVVNQISNELTVLSGDCLHHAKQVQEDYLEDAIAEIRDHLVKDTKRIVKSLERMCDERP